MTALGMSQPSMDQALWSEVVDRVRRRVGARDAEDLVQAAWLRMTVYGATRIVENPAAFLVKTAMNIRLDDWRRERKWLDRNADPDSQHDSAPLPDQVLASQARMERLEAGVAQLPLRTRQIFLMRRLDGLRYAEIAQRFDISESAVEKHIARALVFLTKWSAGW